MVVPQTLKKVPQPSPEFPGSI